MKSNNLLRRFVVFLLSLAITISYMPAPFYAFAQDGEEAAAEPEKQVEQIVEEKKEEVKETTKTEEPKAEAPKEAEKAAEPEEKAEEKTEAAEMINIPQEKSAEAAEADASQNKAEEAQVVEEAPAPKPTPAKNISVKYHFYQLDASGNYTEARTVSKSVSSGKGTTAISKTTANGYVTNKKIAGDNGMVTEFTQIWKNASGSETAFPLSMSYEEAADLTLDGSNVNVEIYAQYSTHKESAKITLRFEDIRKTDGSTTYAETSNSIGWGNGWSITKKKFESTTGLRAGQSFSELGYKYTYTGKWEDQNGNIIDAGFSISLKVKDGETSGNNYFITDDTTVVFRPVYEKKMIQSLEYFFIDNISTGSGSWSNKSEGKISEFSSLKHTFKDPSVATPVAHYRFLYWEKASDERYYAGDTYTFSVDSSLPEGTATTVKIYAYWQPSVTVNYYVNGKLAESKESFDGSIAAYGYEPEMEGADFIGWYAGNDKSADRIADGTAYEAPAVTKDAVDQKVINLYAKFTTSYKVEHYLEQLDGSFALDEAATDLVKDIVIGSIAKAEEKEFEGYTFDDSAAGTIREAAVKVGLELKLFYTLNSYTVNYEYTGSLIPDGAMAQLPASATYKYGETVPAGSVPSIDGYTFSGWTGEVASMPAEDVVVSGSWTKVIVPETPADNDNNDSPEVKPAVKKANRAADDPVVAIVEEAGPAAAPAAEMSNIADNKTPLAAGTWALVNLIAAIMTALGAVIAIFRRKEDDENADENDNENDNRGRKMFAAKIAGAFAGIASLITFIITEDMSLPMAMIDKWTVMMVIMLAVQILAAALNKKASEAEDDEMETAEEAAN